MDGIVRQGGISQKGIFSDLEFYAFICKKTEKLSNAVFLLTQDIAESDPIRTELRKTAVQLLSDVALVTTPSGKSADRIHTRLQTLLIRVLNLVSLASSTGYISKQNADLLQNEYGALSNSLIDYTKKGGGKEVALTPKAFDVSDLYKDLLLDRQIKDISYRTEEKTEPARVYRTSTEQPTSNRTEAVTPKQKTDEERSFKVRHSGRRTVIIRLLTQRPKSSIKDIKSLITDCGEKTIQRELTAMVREGILKKEGERRWSTYSLI